MNLNESVIRYGHTFRFTEVEAGNIYVDADTKKIIGKIESVSEVKDNQGEVTAKKGKNSMGPSFNLIEDKQVFHQALNSASFLYQQGMRAVLKYLNLLPPSAAMEGIYTMVDNSRGVWKAPANVTLNYVDSITEDIDDEKQMDLNAPTKRGGLAGATPEDAYEVHVGLGDTMTGEDILEGIMRITVLVAVTHPAEFIEITFQHQMQKN